MGQGLLIAALIAGILSTVSTLLMGLWAIYRVGSAEMAARERYEATMATFEKATSDLAEAWLKSVTDEELSKALGVQMAGFFFESLAARGNGSIGGHMAAGSMDALPDKVKPFLSLLDKFGSVAPSKSAPPAPTDPPIKLKSW